MKKLIFGFVMLKVLILSVFWTLTFSPPQNAQVARPQPTVLPDTIDRETSQPYKGDLSIFEGEKRAENLQVERVMDVLKITDGKSVADIGAGSGWFTVLAAKRVGAKGKVFAVEINEDAVKHINERKVKENLPNIETVLGRTDDPLLPKKKIDAVLILKTYHEIAEPVRLMKNLLPSLRKDALVGIIDRNGDAASHGINKEVVIDEMKRAGFVLKEEHDFVKGDGMDYLLVFQPGDNRK
jgi:SAM-dependent methyltransferase